MKCRVCGYEISDGRSYCPMCGTKTAAAEKYRDSAATSMAWNTKDFPKPRKMEDIEMNWGEQPSFMKTDASEGSVTVKTEKDQPKKENKDFEIPSFMAQPSYQTQPSYQAAARPLYQAPTTPAAEVKPAADVKPVLHKPQEAFPAWTMPPRQEEPNYQYYNITQPQYQPSPMNMPEYAPTPAYPQRTYTPSPTPASTPAEKQFWYEQDFTATGTMKTGPAFPLVQDRYTAPNAAIGISPEKAASVIQTSVPEATVQYVRMEEPRRAPVQPQVPQAPVQPQQAQPAFRYEQAYPDYDAVNSQAQKRPEQFNTFQTKNEEFQKLLDEEYKRINALRGSDFTIIPADNSSNSFAAQEAVKAQDISAFERSLFGERPAAEAAQPEAEEHAPSGFFNETDSTDLDLNELISDPLDPRFDIDTLEMTIRELKKEEEKDDEKRSERRKRLAAMEAAREAYFRSLDEEAGIKDASAIDPEYDRRDSDIFSPEKKEMKRGSVIAEKAAAEKLIPEEKASDSNPEEKTEDKKPEEIKSEINAESVKPEEKTDDTRLADATVLPVLEDAKPEDKHDIHPDLKDLYEDDDDEEDESKGGSGFLKFLGILIIIIAILELVILALKNFLPDAQITEVATQFELTVIEAVKKAYNVVAGWIKGLTEK